MIMMSKKESQTLVSWVLLLMILLTSKNCVYFTRARLHLWLRLWIRLRLSLPICAELRARISLLHTVNRPPRPGGLMIGLAHGPAGDSGVSAAE